MSVPVETTAAMTTPGDTTSAVAAETAAPEFQPQRSLSPVGTARIEPLTTERAERRSVSPNVVISVLGGLIAALLGGMFALMVWQFGALGDSIDSLSARIDSQGAELGARIDSQGAELRAEMDSLRTELRSEISAEVGMLRAEMQAGFRSINETLLDHTDRLARLEATIADPAQGS